jgi:hypothetical protein
MIVPTAVFLSVAVVLAVEAVRRHDLAAGVLMVPAAMLSIAAIMCAAAI